jgi:hypothetical protein
MNRKTKLAILSLAVIPGFLLLVFTSMTITGLALCFIGGYSFGSSLGE